MIFRDYKHRKVLSNGTIGKLKDGSLVLIDGNDFECCDSIAELNYYVFHELKDSPGQFNLDLGYDSPTYEMINHEDIVEYCPQQKKTIYLIERI